MDTSVDLTDENLYNIYDKERDSMRNILDELAQDSYDVGSVNANPLFDRPDFEEFQHDDDDVTIDDILKDEIKINEEFKNKNEIIEDLTIELDNDIGNNSIDQTMVGNITEAVLDKLKTIKKRNVLNQRIIKGITRDATRTSNILVYIIWLLDSLSINIDKIKNLLVKYQNIINLYKDRPNYSDTFKILEDSVDQYNTLNDEYMKLVKGIQGIDFGQIDMTYLKDTISIQQAQAVRLLKKMQGRIKEINQLNTKYISSDMDQYNLNSLRKLILNGKTDDDELDIDTLNNEIKDKFPKLYELNNKEQNIFNNISGLKVLLNMLKETFLIMNNSTSDDVEKKKNLGIDYLNEDINEKALNYLNVNNDDDKIKLVDIVFNAGNFDQQIDSINEIISILDGLTKPNPETKRSISNEDNESIKKIINTDNLTGGAGKLKAMTPGEKEIEKNKLFEQTRDYVTKNINLDNGFSSIIAKLTKKAQDLENLYMVLIKLKKLDERSILKYIKTDRPSEDDFNKKFENLSLQEFKELLDILIPINDSDNEFADLDENIKIIMKEIIIEKYNARTMSGKDFILDFDIVDQENAKQKLKKNIPNFFDRVKNIVKNDKGKDRYDDDEFEDDGDGGISDSNDSIADDGLADDGLADDGLADDGLADDGDGGISDSNDPIADDDIPDDGLADDGLVDDGLVDDGLADDGLVDDGLADDGLVDNKNEGKTIKPMSTKARYDELKKTAKNKRGVLSALKDYVDKRTRKKVPSPKLDSPKLDSPKLDSPKLDSPKLLDDDNVSRKDPDVSAELDAPVGAPTSPRAAMAKENMEALNTNVNIKKRGKTRRTGRDRRGKYAEVLRPLSTPLGNVGITQAGRAEEGRRLADELLNPPTQQSVKRQDDEDIPSESDLIGVTGDGSIKYQRVVRPNGDRKYAMGEVKDRLKGGKKITKKRTKKNKKNSKI